MTSREPSLFERYYILRGVYGFYLNFNVTAKYNNKITKTNLSGALKSLISKNSAFAVSFFRESEHDFRDDGANFMLRPLGHIRLEDVVSFRTLPRGFFDETTFSAIDKLVVKVDQKNQPLWRLIVWEASTTVPAGNNDQYITFYCDHSLFDGNSGTFFHELLLAELNEFEIKAAQSATTKNDLQPLKLGANRAVGSNINLIEPIQKQDKQKAEEQYDDIIFKNLDPSILVPQLNTKGQSLYNPPMLLMLTKLVEKILTPEIVNRLIQMVALYIYPGDYVNTYDYPLFQYKVCKKGSATHFKLISFNPDEVRYVLAGCKQNGLTLTPYLLVIANQCLQETIIRSVAKKSNSGILKYSSETIIAINNRRYLPPSCAKEIGCIISGVEVALPPIPAEQPPSRLIPQMKDVSRQIQHHLETNYGSKLVGLLKYVRVVDFFQYKLGRHSRQTLEVSNLGKKDFKHGHWEINDLYFSQSNGVATHFALSIISTGKLGMNMSFGYTDDYVEFRDEIESFVSLFKERVLAIS